MLLLVPVLLAAGCWTSATLEKEARGTLIFSIRKVEDSNDAGAKGPTGIFYYMEKSGSIEGYRVENGDVTDIFGGGSFESAELRRKIDRVAFVSFDFESEMKRVDAVATAQAAREGMEYLSPFTLDGGDAEIRFVYGSVNFTLKRLNPLAYIDMYAPDSPKIAKLKALVDCFATHYGRMEMDRWHR